MKFDRFRHRRRSIRLKGWDYRAPGYYFVTICTQKRQYLFEDMEFLEIAAFALQRVPEQKHAQHINLDEWVVMPNHVHAIFAFVDFPAQADMEKSIEQFGNALAGSLGVIVGRYKSAVTYRINNLRNSRGAKVWQRGYYERIVRNERELQAIRKYIIANPARWEEDRENLDNLLSKMTLRSK